MGFFSWKTSEVICKYCNNGRMKQNDSHSFSCRKCGSRYHARRLTSYFEPTGQGPQLDEPKWYKKSEWEKYLNEIE